MTNESREHASDAGDICHICEKFVTWTDHLPPLEAGGPVRCYVNVRFLFPLLGLIEAPGSSAAFVDTALPVEQTGSLSVPASSGLSEKVGERQGRQPGASMSPCWHGVRVVNGEPMYSAEWL